MPPPVAASVPDRPTAPPRRSRKRALAAAAGGAALVIVVAALLLVRDPRPHIEQRRSRIVSTAVDPAPSIDRSGAAVEDSSHRVEHVHLVAASGLEVELAIKWPLASSHSGVTSRDSTMHCATGVARPAVILLGGHRTGRNAVHLVDDTRGTVVAALSYPFAGNHRVKGVAIVGEVPGIRSAVLDTPAALMLAIDHLVARPCIDVARIEAVGVSLGAPFAIIAGALDARISRVWAVHGAGGIYAPLEFNLRRQLGSRAASVPLAALGSVLLSGERLAPERWVRGIAPRPLVMVNALHDERLPRHAVDRLFRAAAEPKEMIWMPGAHVRSEAEAVRPLIELVLARVVGGDAVGSR